MELNVGDYVRTENGLITKIKMFYEQKWEEPKLIYARFLCEDYEIYKYPRQVKSSPNIIDLIEVGDYVNGVLIEEIFERTADKLFIHTFDTEIMLCLTNKNIKSIVTKDQFEAMKYVVGDTNVEN